MKTEQGKIGKSARHVGGHRGEPRVRLSAEPCVKRAARVCGQKYASVRIASAVDRGASSGTCSGVAFSAFLRLRGVRCEQWLRVACKHVPTTRERIFTATLNHTQVHETARFVPCARHARILVVLRPPICFVDRPTRTGSISCYQYIAVNDEEEQPRATTRENMSLYKIGSYVLAFVLLGAVVGLTLAQRDDSFVFPDQVPEKSPGFDSPDLAQMLEIAQKLNDMDSVDDVLKYVEGVPESNLRSPSIGLPGPVSEQDGPILQGGLFHSRIGGDGEERSKAEQPLSAKCEPELQPVTLKVDNDPSKFYYPSCTRIHRCGGCCSHSLLACEPVETNVRNFEVMVMSLVGRKLRYQDKRIVPLEEHTKCKCGCRIKAEHCNERQSYINAECRCACNNVDEAAKCIKNSTKVWNPDRCVCLCRDEQECSTGFYFDQNTCRCKQVLLSKTWFQPTRGTDYRFAQTQKPDNVPPVIVPLDAADPRRKPKDDPEY